MIPVWKVRSLRKSSASVFFILTFGLCFDLFFEKNSLADVRPVISITQNEELCSRAFFEETTLDDLTRSEYIQRSLVRVGLWSDRATALQSKVQVLVDQMNNLGLKISKKKLEQIAFEGLSLLKEKGIVAKTVWVPFYRSKKASGGEDSLHQMVPEFEILSLEQTKVFDKHLKRIFHEISQNDGFWKISQSEGLKFSVSPFSLSGEMAFGFSYREGGGIHLPLMALSENRARNETSLMVKHEVMHALALYKAVSLQGLYARAREYSEEESVLRRKLEEFYLQITTEMQRFEVEAEGSSADEKMGVPFQMGSIYSSRMIKNEEMAYLDVNVLGRLKFCEDFEKDPNRVSRATFLKFKLGVEIESALDTAFLETAISLEFDIRRLKEFFSFHERLYPFLLNELDKTEYLSLGRGGVHGQLQYLYLEQKIKVGPGRSHSLSHYTPLPFWTATVDNSGELYHYVDKPKWYSGTWTRESESRTEGLLRMAAESQLKLAFKITQQRRAQLMAIEEKCKSVLDIAKHRIRATYPSLDWSENKIIEKIENYLAGY